LFVSSAANQKPSESKSLSRTDNRQPQQPYPVQKDTERENWYEDNMCLTRHQLSSWWHRFTFKELKKTFNF